ncbi:efflux transporter periplasmic adaptor subunit [Thiocapsa imhoffii]|uniref:Efflux transporter periplasmic adaptor subunit n=2 Tax=Thiocapsa imhoffii TaxID=382777 RepID=A0A9X0WJL2_9GAMM|nr:efflux transporter periplasmic adaptor subunit [Thiocapsa imhoffii]
MQSITTAAQGDDRSRVAQPLEPSPDTTSVVAATREVELIGFTRAAAQTPLVAETEGRVRQVFLDIGEQVDESGRFAQLDTTFLRLDLEDLRVQQERMRDQIAFDEREVERIRELVRQNSASASQLDALEQSVRDNRHQLRALDVRQRILEERIARATILAPPGHRITARRIEPGQWVSTGETLGSAADFSTLLVPFALTPEQFAALSATADQLGLQPLDATRGQPRAAAPTETLAARIHRVNPSFDPETRKIAVELALIDPVPDPRGGLRLRLGLPLAEATGALSVPRSALASSYDEVWVIRDSGERIPVLPLGPDARDASRMRVSAPGLAEGDRIRLSAPD